MQQLQLLSREEQNHILAPLCAMMRQNHTDAMLLSDNATIYYLTGRVLDGYIYLTAGGEVTYLVRRPCELAADSLHFIRKPEQIAGLINLNSIKTIGLELDSLSYSAATRLSDCLPEGIVTANASPMLRQARSIKTPREIEMLKLSGARHERIYRLIPKLYRDGMTDVELQVEIERASRLEGCLGQFRISGNSMELFMGSVLTGRNADIPSPYDFAMGGEGIDPSLPVGANGSVIEPGTAVMVDMNGNFTGYMTDMTRTFALGQLPDLALKAHQCSIDICHAIAAKAVPGTEAKELYEMALSMATEAGLHNYFMGHRQKAGFVGHGVGIEVNELPVIAPRSRDILSAGNVIALEPKFVIPEVGAVGIENTYVVTDKAMQCITNAPEQIINFE